MRASPASLSATRCAGHHNPGRPRGPAPYYNSRSGMEQVNEQMEVTDEPHSAARRDVLRAGGGLTLLSLITAAGWLAPGEARAEWNKAAFEAKSVDETVKAIGGSGAAPSKD